MIPLLNYGYYPTYQFLTFIAFMVYVVASILIEFLILGLLLERKGDTKISELSFNYFFLIVVLANVVSGLVGFLMALGGF